MAKRIKVGDTVILVGKVTRRGDEQGELTQITVKVEGVEYPVTLPERWLKVSGD